MFRNLENRNAVTTLILVQLVCAINWYSVSSVFSLIAADMNQNVSGLGLITSTFVLGVGLFQVPAGLVAAKHGPKRAVLYGVLLTSSFSVMSGFVEQLTLLAILRFVVGIGEAFIFGPGVILIMRYFRKGSEGLSIGLFGGAFDMGGIIGISGWAVIGVAIGWRASVIAGGVLGLLAGLLLVIVVPDDPEVGGFTIRRSELKRIFFNRSLLLISSGILAIQVVFSLISYFMVYYLEVSLGIGADVAGVVTGLLLAASVLSSPLAGRIFDRNPSPKRSFIVLCLIASVGLAIAGAGSVFAAIVSAVLVGAASGGGYVFGYAIARTVNDVRQEYDALGLSWINGIALFGGVWTPIVFSAIASGPGYAVAWLVAAVFVAVMVLPVFALRSEIGT